MDFIYLDLQHLILLSAPFSLRYCSIPHTSFFTEKSLAFCPCCTNDLSSAYIDSATSLFKYEGFKG